MVGGQHQAHRLGIAPGHPGGGQAAGGGGVAAHGFGQHVLGGQIGKLLQHLVRVQAARDHQHPLQGVRGPRRSTVCCKRLRSPVRVSSCLGLFWRLAGQNRVPEPPAMITAYKFIDYPQKFQARAKIPTAKQ